MDRLNFHLATDRARRERLEAEQQALKAVDVASFHCYDCDHCPIGSGPTGGAAGRAYARGKSAISTNTRPSVPARKPRAVTARSAKQHTSSPDGPWTTAVRARPRLVT